MTHDRREIHRKKRILEYAERVGVTILHGFGRAFSLGADGTVARPNADDLANSRGVA